MSSNRFNYLELGETPWPANPSLEEDEVTPVEAGEPMGPAHIGGGDTAPVFTLDKTRKKALQPDTTEYPVSDKSVYDAAAARQWASEYEDDEGSSAALQSYITHSVQTSSVKSRVELKAVEVFGTRGTAAGEFNFPAGVAVDRAGILFVADLYNHRVQRITPDGGVALVGSKGRGKTQFLAPIGVAVDADRSFYVVEQGNHRVQKFNADGILEFTFGREGQKYGEFTTPTSICISAATGEILVTDSGLACVQRFTLNGEFVGTLGQEGSIYPPLSNPQSVACDTMGNIYVVDMLANRIARYDPLGRFTGHFGGKTPGLNGEDPTTRFTEPRAVTCTQNGKLIVTDGDVRSGRVVVLDAYTGAVETSVTHPARQLGKMSRPSGIAISPRQRTGFPDGLPRIDAYVADSMNNRIIRFECK